MTPKLCKVVPWKTNLEPENHSPILGSWNPNVRAEHDSFQIRNGRGCQKCDISIYWSLDVRTSKMSFIFVWWFSVFKNPQRELHPKESSVLDTPKKKTGTRWAPTILQLLWLRVKEPNKNRPFIRDVTVTPSIGIWPTLYELLFFNFQGLSIHTFDGPLILQHLTSLIDDWGFATHPRWWALFIGQQ